MKNKTIEKINYCEASLKEKISLWILRAIFYVGGKNEFIDKDGDCRKDELIEFFELERYFDEPDEYSREDIFKILKEELYSLEKKKVSTHKTLKKNIKELGSLLGLCKEEKTLLEFITILNQYYILQEGMDLLGNNINLKQAKIAMSKITGLPIKKVSTLLHPSSKLLKTGLVEIDTFRSSLDSIIKIENDNVAANLFESHEDIIDILKESLRKTSSSELSLEDYSHYKTDIDILLPYLKKAIKEEKKGVNILLYGNPGTGKTELTKVIARTLKCKLFEVTCIDEDEEPIHKKNRINAYQISQNILKDKKALLLYDEAEDIFDAHQSIFDTRPQDNKAWINKSLENNPVPTFWISNNIHSIDEAIIRRFDMCIKMGIPKKSKRKEIIKKYDKGLLDEKAVELLASHEVLSPAIISRATEVASSLHTQDLSTSITHLISNTLKAQGYKELAMSNSNPLPDTYDTAFINTTTDTKKLLAGIKDSKSARLCLYGPPGTGKSAYGQYIAKSLELPCIVKKGSDLISAYVGATEKNIARAFEEAEEEKAVLIFDEVDGFLQERTTARNSWEKTQVNEMLVQMENYDGIFIATTNLMDNLDSASLRRFDLKLLFDYLTQEQTKELFMKYCKKLELKKIQKNFDLQELTYVTPGDFAAIARQQRFNPVKTGSEFYSRLLEEVALKNVQDSGKLGFI